jgi:hypothetical protein
MGSRHTLRYTDLKRSPKSLCITLYEQSLIAFPAVLVREAPGIVG